MQGNTQAIIDLAALRHNLSVVKEAVTVAKVFCVIKANAYGHGSSAIAAVLSDSNDCDGFAVARVSEALSLRKQGVRIPIIVLSGFSTEDELKQAIEQRLELVVHSEQQLELLQANRASKPVSIWLKLNTGMNRLGVEPAQLTSFVNRIDCLANVRKPIKFMTHLSCADDLASDKTAQQISLFDQTIKDYPHAEQSIANSAALLAWPLSQRSWVRPGIMLYGANPFVEGTAEKLDLQPVMTLKSQVLSIRDVAKGACIGYGGSWQAANRTRVATIGIGYGDGYPRHAEEGTPVLVAGQQASLIGRVSMDSITVDISHCHNINISDEVVLWGKGLPVELVASNSSAISYELFCGVTTRVPRIYQG